MTAETRYTIDCDTLPGYTAAYLRVSGEECAFIETHTAHAVPRLMSELASRGHRPEDVRWVVVTHAHLDHAGGASALLARCPNATLLAHPRTARHMVDPARLIAGATEVYGAARFAELYGSIEPIPASRVQSLGDGESFELGSAALRVHHTAGHAWHHFVVDDPATGTVYTGDAFGLAYPALQRAGRFALATTSPTGFDAPEARRSIDKILSLGEPSACLTHFGEVRDLGAVAAQLRGWINRSERWQAEASASGERAPTIAARLQGEIRGEIAQQAALRGLSLGEDDWTLLRLDIELNAMGIAVVSESK